MVSVLHCYPYVLSFFWIPAHTQRFVEAHDKSLALAGMTSCGTAGKSPNYTAIKNMGK